MYAGIIGLRKASAILVLALDDEISYTLDAGAEHACKSKEVFVLDALRAACRRELALAEEAAPDGNPAIFVGHRPGALFPSAPGEGHLNRLRLPRVERRTIRIGNEALYTVAEAAFRVGLGESTIGRAITVGELACMRTSKGGKSIRIPEHAINDFVAALGKSIKGRTKPRA
jgi:excisionase family DNA binding protein